MSKVEYGLQTVSHDSSLSFITYEAAVANSLFKSIHAYALQALDYFL
jgi:hypothetical protein